MAVLIVVAGLSPVPAVDAQMGGLTGVVGQAILVDLNPRLELLFRFCSGLTCGDADPECFSNKWIPSFPEPRVILAVPPGGFEQATEVLVERLDTDGNVVSEQKLRQAGEVLRTLNQLQIDLHESSKGIIQNLRAHTDGSGKLCGFTDDEKAGFVQEFGTGLDTSASQMRITILWKPPAEGEVIPPVRAQLGSTTLNSGHEHDTVAAVAARQAAADLEPASYAEYRQDKGDWADDVVAGAPFKETGTVATALANLLSGLGRDEDPAAVGQALAERGAWTPGSGVGWDAMRGYVGSLGLQHTETTLLSATGSLSSAGTALASTLAAFTDRSGKEPTETVVVLTGYDPGKDRVTMLDPVRGERTMTVSELAAGNPYLLQVATQRQQEAYDTLAATLRAQSEAQLATIRNLR
ncbi:MAG TPA: hypothetical protein VI854_06050 [Acidimicrobiia bacterium]|nr:hypothetical protein [Acidimicrobiia bacterium]